MSNRRSAIEQSVTASNLTNIKAEDKFRQLRIKSQQIMLLTALSEHRNLRRAAAEIHTTQPAASALLQQLEERLGVLLFVRHPRGMEPTTYGEVMIRYARGVLHDFEHARDEIATLVAGETGLVRIGSVMGAVPKLLTECLQRFQKSHPRVSLSVTVDTSDMLVPALIRGDLDLVLGRLPDGFRDSALHIKPLKGESMSVVARPKHPLFKNKSLTLNHLVGCRWILHPEGSPMRRRIEQAMSAAGVTALPDIIESASILATTAILEVTDTISVVPLHVAEHYARHGMLAILPVDMPLTMAKLGIITRANREPSPALTELLESLNQILSK
jgi:DNA-binding transcriptional LysR family regulator